MAGDLAVKGERKTRMRRIGSSATPAKRSIRLTGSMLKSIGGMKRAQAVRHSGVAGNCSAHQRRQRWRVRVGTSNVSPSCVTANVDRARPADINTTASPRYTRWPRKRTDIDVVRLRHWLQQKLKRDSKSARASSRQARGLRG